MKEKEIKKIEPYTPYWNKLANILARDFAPIIYPCATCGYPVPKGYCCNTCGNSDPQHNSNYKEQV